MRHGAYSITQTLQTAGHTAYFVGGCVRDQLLGLDPADYDIATSATPEAISRLFPKAEPVGKAFGVMLVRADGHMYEVATFRADGEYSDGRRPDSVQFSSAEADAQRRDFTLNGIFYDPISDKYHDFVGGIQDLKRGLLRFIGKADARVKEDHLRLLRAVRFAARFGFEYAPETKQALKQHASLVVHISPERIVAELTKMLTHTHRSTAMQHLHDCTLLEKIIPEVTDCEAVPQKPDHHSEGNVLNHLFLCLAQLGGETTPAIAWATLLHDIGKTPTMKYQGQKLTFQDHALIGSQMVQTIAKRLSFSRGLERDVTWLVKHHHLFGRWAHLRPGRKLEYFDHPLFDDLLQLHRADILGCIPAHWADRAPLKKNLEALHKEYYDARAAKHLPSDRLPLLSGHDVKRVLQIPDGPQVGRYVQAVRLAQLEHQFDTRAGAEAWLRDYSAAE